MKNTFKKAERLTKKKLIEELFAKGSYFYLAPFKVVYLEEPSIQYHQVLISVPKRIFKKAVTRNKLKRRIREAYRLNKDDLQMKGKLLIGYIYTSKKVEKSDLIHQSLIKSLEKLNLSFSEEKQTPKVD